MARIGDFQLPPEQTVIDSRTEFVLGRVRRLVAITTFLTRFTDREAFLLAVESLERELERFDQGDTDLSITEGRVLRGRRHRWERTLDEARCLAVGRLLVLTDDRYERSEDPNEESVSISASPQTIPLTSIGNWSALPKIVLTAGADLEHPSFSDGVRTIETNLVLETGQVLELDAENRTATIDGTENALSLVSGDFPELASGSTDLVYSDQTVGTVDGDLVISWRDRWVG